MDTNKFLQIIAALFLFCVGIGALIVGVVDLLRGTPVPDLVSNILQIAGGLALTLLGFTHGVQYSPPGVQDGKNVVV